MFNLLLFILICALVFLFVSAHSLRLTTKILKAGSIGFSRAFSVQFVTMLVSGAILVVLYLFKQVLAAEIASVVVGILIFSYYLKIDLNTKFKKAVLIYIVSTIITAIVTFGLAFTVRIYVFSPFLVAGQSMAPTYNDQDYLFVNKLMRTLERRDIVIYAYNDDAFIIQRVIGLPGENVTIKNNVVRIDGEILAEAYVVGKTEGDVDVKLGPAEYFLMGDNREQSYDSRKRGPVPAEMMIGEVFKNFGKLFKD